MGRLLLLLVAAGAAAGLTATFGGLDARNRQAGRLAESGELAMARQAALSGFAVLERAVRTDPEGDHSSGEVAVAGPTLGTYETRAAEEGNGLRVVVTGRYGDAEHRIEAVFEEVPDVPATLVVHAAEAEVSGSDGFSINGAVHRPPSVAADGWFADRYAPAAGVAASSSRLQDVLLDGWGSQRSRITGAPSFAIEEAPAWVHGALREAPRHPAAIVKEGLFRRAEGRIGSPDNPVVLVANGGAHFEDAFRGYGLLVVSKKLVMWDDARWEGVILVRGGPDAVTPVHLEDESRIYGALVLHGTDGESGAEPRGAFTLRTVDSSDILWSVDPLKRLADTLGFMEDLFVVERRFTPVRDW